MTIKASWIGLGVMGFPMAGHLASNKDVEVTVYNRSAEKAEMWVQKYKGKSAATPAPSTRTPGPAVSWSSRKGRWWRAASGPIT